MRTSPVTALTAAVLLAWLGGCQPDTITGARDQLQRGAADTLDITIPLLIDTIGLAEFLSETDTVTTRSGALGVRAETQTFAIAVAENLRLDDIGFEPFSVGYEQMLQTQEVTLGVSVPLPPLPPFPAALSDGWIGPSGPSAALAEDTVRFATPNGSTVTSAVIASGVVVRSIVNSTNCGTTSAVELLDALGDTLVAFPSVAVPEGMTLVDSASLAGAELTQFISVAPTVSVTGCTGVPAGEVAVDFTFRSLTMASVSLANVDEDFASTYVAVDNRLDPIDTVSVRTGFIDLDVRNRLPLEMTLDVTFRGVLVAGSPLEQSFVVPAAPGDGSTVNSTRRIDLTGATIIPGDGVADVAANVTSANATLTDALVADAASIDATGSLSVNYVVGNLDPDVTPELTQIVEAEELVEPSSVDFDDYEDAVRGATINDAVLTVSVTNGLQTPFRLDTFQVGVARTDVTGSALRDAAGDVVFETDDSGAPILLTLALAGENILTLPSSSVTEITRDAPELVDRLVHLLLDDENVALVGAGNVRVGDGSPSRISATDSISFQLDVVVGMDLSLPDTGIVIDVTRAVEAAGFDPADAAEISSRLIEARGIALLENGIPFEAMVEVAIAAGNLGEEVDVFTLPGHVSLPGVTLAAAIADPLTGRTLQATSDSVATTLTGEQSMVLLGDSATATVRIRLMPPSDSNGRAAIRPGDSVTIELRARLRALFGGGS